MGDSLDLRISLANQEEERIAAAEKVGAKKRAHRMERTIYHFQFHGYFTWKVARIPMVQRHDTEILHHGAYGAPVELHKVTAFLKELTGEKFESVFGFEAGRTEYEYLDDLIEEALRKHGLHKLGTEAEDAGVATANVERARAWLREQIEISKQIARHGPSEVGPSEVIVAEAAKPDNETGEAAPLTTALPADKLPKDTGLTMRQVVLWRLYVGLKLVRSRADQVARDAGFDARTSGQQLWDQHRLFAPGPKSRTNVVGKAVHNLCIDIAAVIPYLPKDKRQQAEYELQQLELKK